MGKPVWLGMDMAISATTKELQDGIAAWITSSFLDRVARYAREGRRHAHLDRAALQHAWVRAVRAMAENVRSTARRERQHDLEAEYRLRRVEPPYHLVEEAMALYTRRANEMLLELLRDDPQALAALADTVASDLDGGRRC